MCVVNDEQEKILSVGVGTAVILKNGCMANSKEKSLCRYSQPFSDGIVRPTRFFQFPPLRVVAGLICPINRLNARLAAVAAAAFPRLGADGFV